MFAVQKSSGTDFHSGAIAANAQYKLLLFIKDGAKFDLDGGEDGKVMDPVALLKVEPVGSEGGGGCTTGYLPFALLLGIPLVFRKRK